MDELSRLPSQQLNNTLAPNTGIVAPSIKGLICRILSGGLISLGVSFLYIPFSYGVVDSLIWRFIGTNSGLTGFLFSWVGMFVFMLIGFTVGYCLAGLLGCAVSISKKASAGIIIFSSVCIFGFMYGGVVYQGVVQSLKRQEASVKYEQVKLTDKEQARFTEIKKMILEYPRAQVNLCAPDAMQVQRCTDGRLCYPLNAHFSLANPRESDTFFIVDAVCIYDSQKAAADILKREYDELASKELNASKQLEGQGL